MPLVPAVLVDSDHARPVPPGILPNLHLLPCPSPLGSEPGVLLLVGSEHCSNLLDFEHALGTQCWSLPGILPSLLHSGDGNLVCRRHALLGLLPLGARLVWRHAVLGLSPLGARSALCHYTESHLVLLARVVLGFPLEFQPFGARSALCHCTI